MTIQPATELRPPIGEDPQDRHLLLGTGPEPTPRRVRGRGIAVIDQRDNLLDVLLVDDLRGRALRLRIDSWR